MRIEEIRPLIEHVINLGFVCKIIEDGEVIAHGKPVFGETLHVAETSVFYEEITNISIPITKYFQPWIEISV